MNSNGSSQTKIYGSVQDIISMAESPLGNEFLLSQNMQSGSQLLVLSYPGNVVTPVTTDAGVNFQGLGWAPDGSKVVFMKDTGTTSEVDTATPELNNRVSLISFNDRSVSAAGWEPFPVALPFVSSTGGYVLSNASSGFLYGLNGDGFSSFLSFTCTTPTTATVTADPVTPGQSNLIYRLNGDAITSIKYVNGFGAAVYSVSTGGAKQAVVAFNGGTGGIVSILIGLKMAPVASKTGDGAVYSGTFTGVYDAHGKNLAAAGPAW